MDEKQLKLLKFALTLAETALEEIQRTAEFCENMDNDFYYMKKNLAEKLEVNYEEISD